MFYQLRQLTDLMLPRSLFLGDSERQAEREINIHIALGEKYEGFYDSRNDKWFFLQSIPNG